MNPYRVLHLIDHMGPGGAQRLVRGVVMEHAHHYAAALRRKGSGQFSEGLPRFRQPRSQMRAAAIYQLLSLPRIFREEQIDILHCHLNFSWLTGLWLSRILMGGNLRVIFHEHDPNEVNAGVYRRILAGVSKRGRVIAISRHVQGRLVELGVQPERIHRLPNYVSPSLFVPHPRRRTIDDTREFTVGFAGRLVERKGWRHFLEAAIALSGGSMRFYLAGDGSDRKAVVKRIERERLEGSVKVLGHVMDMREFFRQIDVFMMPVSAEPMGLAQLEAQAAGVPVVAFNVPGIDETLSTGNAMLVKPGDIAGLAAAVRQLQSEPELYTRLSFNGHENAKRFSFDLYMEHLDSIYREALA